MFVLKLKFNIKVCSYELLTKTRFKYNISFKIWDCPSTYVCKKLFFGDCYIQGIFLQIKRSTKNTFVS